MNVEVVKRELDYYILEVKSRTDNKDKEYLTWDYSNASCFVILKLNVRFDLNQINTNDFITKLCSKLSESFDMNGKPYQGEIEIDNDIKISIISLNQYKRTNSWYYEPSPMKVVVLCGELREDSLRIHMPEDISMCSTFIPEKVKIEAKKENIVSSPTGLFGGFRRMFGQQDQPTKDIYTVKVSNLNQNYRDGIYYRIKGHKVSYPITPKMSSALFEIEVPIGKELEFYVRRDKIKEYVLSVRIV